MHGPCNQEYPNAPCMVNGVCKKCYLQVFFEETTQGEDGYPVYRWQRQLPCLPWAKRWSNVSKDPKWLCIQQPMGGAPQPLPQQDV